MLTVPVDEDELDAATDDSSDRMPIPEGWWTTSIGGRPMPDVLAIVRRDRRTH